MTMTTKHSGVAVLSLLAVLATSQDAAAQGKWKDVGRTPSGNIVSVDPRSVKRTGQSVAATVRVLFTTPVKMPQGMLTSSQTRATFDCTRRAVAVKENALYGDARGTRVLERHVNKLPGYGPALGGSPVEIALTYLCGH